MPSGHALTHSKGIHTLVIYQPPANSTPIAGKALDRIAELEHKPVKALKKNLLG